MPLAQSPNSYVAAKLKRASERESLEVVNRKAALALKETKGDKFAAFKLMLEDGGPFKAEVGVRGRRRAA